MKIIVSKKSFENVEDLLERAGRYASACYSDDGYVEDGKSKSHIARFCIKNGHHSIFDHFNITFIMKDIPKVLCLYLNNIGSYNTTEKSGRYSNFTTDSDAGKYYEKWKTKFENIIMKSDRIKESIKKDAKLVTKLAMENARYFLPYDVETDIVYTISYRNLSYLISIFKNNKYDENFEKIKNEFLDEICSIKELGLDEVKLDYKDGQSFYLEDKLINKPLDNNNDEYIIEIGYNQYNVRYQCSIACFAQLQRHRTIDYIFHINHNNSDGIRYYIPPIINNDSKFDEELTEYINDMTRLIDDKKIIPQGYLIDVHEYGTISAFRLKCLERLCGRAQLEICDLTNNINKRLCELAGFDESYPFYDSEKSLTRCKNHKCSEPCSYGINGLDRII